MAHVTIRCRSCETKLKIDAARFAGKTLKCPKCQTAFKLPANAAGKQSTANASRPSGSKAASSKRNAAAKRKAVAAGTADEFDGLDDGLFDSLESGFGGGGGAPRTLPPVTRRRKQGRKSAVKPAEVEKETPERPGKRNNKVLIIGGSVLGFGVLVGLAFLFGGVVHPSGSGQAVDVPQQFENFANEQGAFRCEYPAGWNASGGGGTGGKPAWAKFEKGGVIITIRDSLAGSAVGDISRSTNQMATGGVQEELPDELEPVAKVHEFRKSYAENEMDHYQEKPPVVIQTGFGEGRMSEFTARTTFFGTIYGYRATLLNNRYQFNVYCKCYSEADWNALKPTFRKVIESIH